GSAKLPRLVLDVDRGVARDHVGDARWPAGYEGLGERVNPPVHVGVYLVAESNVEAGDSTHNDRVALGRVTAPLRLPLKPTRSANQNGPQRGCCHEQVADCHMRKNDA